MLKKAMSWLFKSAIMTNIHQPIVSDQPNEWAKIGEVSCDGGILQDADVIVEPPSNGLL